MDPKIQQELESLAYLIHKFSPEARETVAKALITQLMGEALVHTEAQLFFDLTENRKP